MRYVIYNARLNQWFGFCNRSVAERPDAQEFRSWHKAITVLNVAGLGSDWNVVEE